MIRLNHSVLISVMQGTFELLIQGPFAKLLLNAINYRGNVFDVLLEKLSFLQAWDRDFARFKRLPIIKIHCGQPLISYIVDCWRRAFICGDIGGPPRLSATDPTQDASYFISSTIQGSIYCYRGSFRFEHV